MLLVGLCVLVGGSNELCISSGVRFSERRSTVRHDRTFYFSIQLRFYFCSLTSPPCAFSECNLWFSVFSLFFLTDCLLLWSRIASEGNFPEKSFWKRWNRTILTTFQRLRDKRWRVTEFKCEFQSNSSPMWKLSKESWRNPADYREWDGNCRILECPKVQCSSISRIFKSHFHKWRLLSSSSSSSSHSLLLPRTARSGDEAQSRVDFSYNNLPVVATKPVSTHGILFRGQLIVVLATNTTTATVLPFCFSS